jgi:hypothetical protein
MGNVELESKKNGQAYFHYPESKTTYTNGWRIFLEETWYQDIPIQSSSFSSRPYFVKQSWGPWLFLFHPEQEHNDSVSL